MHRSGNSKPLRRRSGQLFVCALAACLLAAFSGISASAAAAAPIKPPSSCVACHTDAEKLKAEAATIPVPAGSALQAGKG